MRGACAAVIAVLFCLPAFAENPEQARDDRRYKKACSRPRFLIPFTDAEAHAFSNLTKLATDARLCRNLNKLEPPREPGCLVENVVAGGLYDKLKLKNDDWVIGNSEGAIKTIDQLLAAVGAIAKEKKGCLVVTRSHWTFGIAYFVKNTHLEKPKHI